MKLSLHFVRHVLVSLFVCFNNFTETLRTENTDVETKQVEHLSQSKQSPIFEQLYLEL